MSRQAGTLVERLTVSNNTATPPQFKPGVTVSLFLPDNSYPQVRRLVHFGPVGVLVADDDSYSENLVFHPWHALDGIGLEDSE